MKREKVHVTLTNRTATLEFPFPAEIRKVVSYTSPSARFSQAFRLGHWDGSISMMRGSVMTTGLFIAMREKIEEDAKVAFVVDDQRGTRKYPAFKVKAGGEFEVRGYQTECVEAMRANGTSGGIVLNATGTGKTFIAGLYMKYSGAPAVFLTDELLLANQAKKELEAVTGEEVGMVGDGEFSPKRITVALVQSIGRNLKKAKYRHWFQELRKGDLFADEIHEQLNARMLRIIQNIQPQAVFGFTATLQLSRKPVRLSAFNIYGPILYSFLYDSGLDKEVLAPGVCISVYQDGHIDKKKYADAHVMYESVIVRNKKRNQFVVDLAAYCHTKGHSVVILVDRVKHVRLISDMLDPIPHGRLYGLVNAKRRIKTKSKLDDGNLRMVVANRVFKKGINIKRIDVIIDAACLPSKNDVVQKYGRGVRQFTGKDGLLYFDIGYKRGPLGHHNYSKATTSRKGALRKIGVPVYSANMITGVQAIYRAAKDKLAKAVLNNAKVVPK